MEHINLEQLEEKFKEGNLIGFQDTEGKKYRLFISANGLLCYYGKGMSRRGYQLAQYQLDKFKKFIFKGGAGALTKEQREFKIIHKYKTYAEKAKFSNDWIDKCLELPETFNEWVAEGKKSLYQYGITTGVRIEGRVITVQGIAKQYPYIADGIKQAIKEGKDYRSSRCRFRGYDMSVEIRYDQDNGDMRGWLSMEYKDCGNGNYYLLINNNSFIGYDVD